MVASTNEMQDQATRNEKEEKEYYAVSDEVLALVKEKVADVLETYFDRVECAEAGTGFDFEITSYVGGLGIEQSEVVNLDKESACNPMEWRRGLLRVWDNFDPWVEVHQYGNLDEYGETPSGFDGEFIYRDFKNYRQDVLYAAADALFYVARPQDEPEERENYSEVVLSVDDEDIKSRDEAAYAWLVREDKVNEAVSLWATKLMRYFDDCGDVLHECLAETLDDLGYSEATK